MTAQTRSGIDVLQQNDFAPLHDRRIGLITNHTGLDWNGIATADLLHAHPKVQLAALFGPEHGIRGALDEKVPDGKDAQTGLPVYSLYGQRTRPLPSQLTGLDMLVYDIQDVGARFYTYISTLGLCMEAAAEIGLPFMVLDRPNPIGGAAVEGALADGNRLSFTAHHPIPVQHGMTVGELARLFQAEKASAGEGGHAPVPLLIIPVENWRRSHAWDQTGLTWINPSPNMRSLGQAFLYPGVGLLEFTNVSVGRGTDTPFEIVGAPWLDGRRLAQHLNAQKLPGVRFVPIRFTPNASKFMGQSCGGINLIVTRREGFKSVLTGFALACGLRDLFKADWEPARYITLLANAALFHALEAGASPHELEAMCAADVQAFHARSAPHRLYQ